MVTSVLRDEQYMFGVKSFLVAEKSVVDDERPGHQVAATTDSSIAAVDSFNEFARSVEK